MGERYTPSVGNPFEKPKPDAERNDPTYRLKEVEKRLELLEHTRVTWMTNVIKLNEAIPLDDSAVESEKIAFLRGERNRWLSFIDELDRLEKLAHQERAELSHDIN